MKKKLLLILLLNTIIVLSQINISSDITNRYIYRGTNVGGNSFHIQPSIKYNTNLDSLSTIQLSLWGTFGLDNKYKEVDFGGKYSIHNISFIVSVNYNPFDKYNNKIINPFTNEFILSYDGCTKFPFTFTIESYFYGNDKNYGYNKNLDKNNSLYHSTYIEVGYFKIIGINQFNIFTGFTPWSGMFSNKPSFVNIGITDNTKIKILNKNLPIYDTILFNPSTNKMFFLIGITI